MTKKKLIAALLCTMVLMAVMTGCGAGKAGDAVSNAMSEAGEGISKAMSRVEDGLHDAGSRVESFLEGNHSSMHEDVSGSKHEDVSGAEDSGSVMDGMDDHESSMVEH